MKWERRKSGGRENGCPVLIEMRKTMRMVTMADGADLRGGML